MISQRGIKLHPGIEQGLVWDGKFLLEVAWLVSSVNIVARA